MIFDSFDGGPSLQSFFAHVSSETTFFDSTKGDIRAEHRPRIDSNLARLEGFGDSVSSADVVGEDRGTQAMEGVIGFGDDLFLGGEFGNALFPKNWVRWSGQWAWGMGSALTATGPKISSRMIVASSGTSAKAVF